MDLAQALAKSAAGMDAQTRRLRMIAENLADQDSTGLFPGVAPSPRQHVSFHATGYPRTPNVNNCVETTDMREAERSHSASLDVMQASRSMLTRAIDLLK